MTALIWLNSIASHTQEFSKTCIWPFQPIEGYVHTMRRQLNCSPHSPPKKVSFGFTTSSFCSRGECKILQHYYNTSHKSTNRSMFGHLFVDDCFWFWAVSSLARQADFKIWQCWHLVARCNHEEAGSRVPRRELLWLLTGSGRKVLWRGHLFGVCVVYRDFFSSGWLALTDWLYVCHVLRKMNAKKYIKSKQPTKPLRDPFGF